MDLHVVILSWDGFQRSAWIAEVDVNHVPVPALPNGWNADEELDRISELLLFLLHPQWGGGCGCKRRLAIVDKALECKTIDETMAQPRLYSIRPS